MLVLLAQSCPTLCDPTDCSLPGSSVHGILQARILEWVAIPFSRGYSYPGLKPRSPALKADSLPSEPPRRSDGWALREAWLCLPIPRGLERRHIHITVCDH